MSNTIVGSVYQQIIDKVISASENDFEEFGVDQTTLNEMRQVCAWLTGNPAYRTFLSAVAAAARSRTALLSPCHVIFISSTRSTITSGHVQECRLTDFQGWQEKLSALKVAQFPWDPQPEVPRQPPTVPSNVKADADLPPASAPQDSLNFPNVPVKTEGGGYQPPLSAYPQTQTANGGGYGGGYEPNLASQRAANLVQQRVMQGQMQHPQQQQQYNANFPNIGHQNHGPVMPQNGAQQQQQQQQQQRMMAAQQQQQRLSQQMPQQRPPPQNHMYNSQTDGAGDAMADWNALKAARAAALQDEAGRLAADQFMRARIDAMAMRQDSGLMVPLDSMPKGKKRKAAVRVLQAEDAEASSSAPGPGRFDGDDDVREEDPEDAINSDLDDPEDELNDGDNSDDEMVDYMLCTYDKVQRVKNKWKCTLKDGILTTNKKEYLFHKANGEFEW
ncbi:transcription factor IIA, alpha/beta subunit-domain-containing protein [Ampelomyces quisqualis]|uniref:Transcription factor IIA, alpha/beta subunit-domain-containing protein n=1 Tax=Ampelomyces quisqualis TaxID=50730 RepID=A0A6A5QIR2_AMPQU|nr:transcription factor IIA, alpha/beta subunit-domain-containing protein [Ampelomyces quisqualis]